MGTAESSAPYVPDYANKPVTMLRNPVINAISLVDKGANKRRFYMFKRDDSANSRPLHIDSAGEATLLEPDFEKVIPLIKAGPSDDEWKVVYCVVAVPHEVDAQKDVWDTEEIRKAAHDYLKKSRLINFMHKDLDSVGELVESAIAPVDLKVGDQTIPQGSWFIGIEPHPELKKQIAEGTITGVSVQGASIREEVDVDRLQRVAKEDDVPVVDEPAHEIPESRDEMEIPKGTEGPGVERLQKFLGIPITGVYDDTTDKAVRMWMENQGVPGKPTLLTIKLILAEAESELGEQETESEHAEGDDEEVTKEQPEENLQVASGQEELDAVWKSKGAIYHYVGDDSRTPVWISELHADGVVVELPSADEGELVKVYLDELEKCGDPDSHYPDLVKNYSNPQNSFGGGPYNPTETTGEATQQGDGYGMDPEKKGTQTKDVNEKSSAHALKAVVMRAMQTGNEALQQHLLDVYGLTTPESFQEHSFSHDELWAIASKFVVGSVEKSESHDVNHPTNQLPSKSGEPVLAGSIVKLSDDRTARVSSVHLNSGNLTVEVLPMDGDVELVEIKAEEVEVVVADPANNIAQNVIVDVDSFSDLSKSEAHDLSLLLSDILTSDFNLDTKVAKIDVAMSALVKKDNPDTVEVSKSMANGDNLRGATVQDSTGKRWVVMKHEGDEVVAVSGRNRQTFAVSEVSVWDAPLTTNTPDETPADTEETPEVAESDETPADTDTEETVSEDTTEAPVLAMAKAGYRKTKKESEPTPEDLTEGTDAGDDVDESGKDVPKNRLARLIDRARRKKKNKEADMDEVKKSAALDAAKIERLRETRDFLDSVLSGAGVEDEAEATAEANERTESVEDEAAAVAEAVETEVAKDVDASEEATEENMSDSDITLDQVVEAVNGLSEEVDGVLTRMDDLSTLNDKLDQVGELAKALDTTERTETLEKAIERLAETVGAMAGTIEQVEELNKRLTALEDTPGASTAAPVDTEPQAVAKSDSEPPMFTRGGRSIF